MKYDEFRAELFRRHGIDLGFGVLIICVLLGILFHPIYFYCILPLIIFCILNDLKFRCVITEESISLYLWKLRLRSVPRRSVRRVTIFENGQGSLAVFELCGNLPMRQNRSAFRFFLFRLRNRRKLFCVNIPEAAKKEAADILRDAFGKKVRSRTGRRLF